VEGPHLEAASGQGGEEGFGRLQPGAALRADLAARPWEPAARGRREVAWGCSRCVCQIRCTERREMAISLSHGPAGPVGCLAGRLGTDQLDHPMHGHVAQGALPGLRSSPSTPASADRHCQRQTAGRPTRHAWRSRRGRGTSAHRLSTQATLVSQVAQMSPRYVLQGAVAIGDHRVQTSAIPDRNQRTGDLSHGPRRRTSAALRESFVRVTSLAEPRFGS
jgi:hypothetical protein